MDQRRRRCAPVCAQPFPEAERYGGQPDADDRAPGDAAQDWTAGAAYVDGVVMPLREARIPVTDWGYRRSDVTYDVVSVYFGAFFRLRDHLRRFRGSMEEVRLNHR